MKRMHGGARKWTFGLCMLMATLLFGPVIAKADPVLDWNAIAVDTAVANGQNPFAQARFAAIVQVAVFEAVNAITGDYRPYLGSIDAPHGASADAAAIQAAYRVLSTYFPTARQRSTQPARTRWHRYRTAKAKIDGIATGDAAANALIALRANDGSSPPQFKTPGPPVPGEWQATRELSNCEWSRVGNRLSMAERNPVRYPEREGLSPRSPASPQEQRIREDVQRGDDGGEPRQHRAATRSVRCRDLLRGHLANPGIQSGRKAGRAGTEAFAVRECPGSGPDQHGDQRQPGRYVLQQVPLQLLAPRNRDPCG